MNNGKERTIIWIVTIIIVLLIGIIAYKVSFPNIFSDDYLSSKEEEEKSFNSNENVKDTEDGKSFDFNNFTGKWSLMNFTAEKDTKIIIDDNTKINKGKFCIVVLDSDYNVIAKKKELKGNVGQNIGFTVPKSGQYIIRIVGKNASGKFDVRINANNKIIIEHKDLFQ